MPRAASARPAPLPAAARRLVGPACAVAFVLLAMGLRLLLSRWIPALAIFSLFYPAILGAALIGGELSALIALGLSFGLAWVPFLGVSFSTVTPVVIAFNLLLFAVSGAFVGGVGARLRGLLQRRRQDIAQLAEREARYRTLFEGVSEGFALLEAIWDENDRLVDFVVAEVNPALLAMFGARPGIVGRRQTELQAAQDPGYMAALARAFRGQPSRLEVASGSGRRWFDIRLDPVGKDRVAQLVVDITERKAAESRQSEMFEELNHRVKNNLAAVSAMLAMQARIAEIPELRDHLQKAVDRIETIGDVHASLYQARGSHGADGDKVDFAAYLERLCQRLGATIVDSERIRLVVAADPAVTSLDEAVAVGLIFNELVTNAAKYAYPPPGSGVIRVELRDTAAGLLLSVRDEGIGLPETPGRGGIGMRLVRSLVQQCQGELEVGGGPGACFTIRLPRHAPPSDASFQSRLL